MKKYKGPVCMLFVLGCLGFGFQNCGDSSFVEQSSLDVSDDSAFNEDQLLEMLTLAGQRAVALEDVQSDEKFGAEARRISVKLIESKNKIMSLMSSSVSIGDTRVLAEVDYLNFLLSEGRDVLIQTDLEGLKQKVERNRLAIANLGAEFNEFKSAVNVRLDRVDGLIDSLTSRYEVLSDELIDLDLRTSAADAALNAALERLREHIDVDIAKLYSLNEQLSADIVAQKGVLEELFEANEQVANLQEKMCTIGDDGNVSDVRTKCSSVAQLTMGSSSDDAAVPNCCLTVEVVDCSTLFPGDDKAAARSQCGIIIASIKNHDAQLQAIREVDEKQTELIAGLLDDVQNLNEQTKILADGQVILAEGLQAMADKVAAMDARLLIVEFKASRAEAAASIQERVSLTKAWIIQRQRDVQTRFCRANFHEARSKFDYEAQRHNWDYCHYKMGVLSRASVALKNIEALTSGIEALNVDGACTANINGKTAEALSISELLIQGNFDAIVKGCARGPALAKAKLLNAVKALDLIAPDFRTLGNMAKKAKIAQMIFIGSSVAEANSARKAAFTDINPLSGKNRGTTFGQIESIFENKYVQHILRDASGRMPEDIQVIASAKIPSSNAVYSRAQMSAQLKAEEVNCSKCTWGVRGRSNAGGVNTGSLATGKIQFPKDIENGLCPIENDVVVLQNKSDQAYYAYTINYDKHGAEVVRGLNWWGNHVRVASSTANFNAGNTVQGRFWGNRSIYKNGLPNMDLRGRFVLNVTKPYGKVFTGKGNCLHFTAALPMKRNEWVASNSNTNLLYRYLSGYSNAANGFLANKCKDNVGSLSRVRTVDLTNEEMNRLYIADSTGNDIATFQKRNMVSNSNTQLGSNYWVLRKSNKELNYGSAENPSEMISSASPFFGPSSTSTMAIKSFGKASHVLSAKLQKQECTPNE
jgi:phosphoglycolate phosphatase-like HAD superfamily hydrolase